MNDSDKTKAQLLEELAELRQRVAALEALDAENKSLEEALKATEDRFRSLIAHTTDAVFCYEFDSPIPIDLPAEEQVQMMYEATLAECNDVCARSYGDYQAKDVVGRKLTDLFGATPGSLDDLFSALIQNDYQIIDGLGVERLPDGTERHFLNNGYGVIEDGRLVRVWGTFRDVTEQTRAVRVQAVLFDIARATAESRDLEELLKIIHDRLGTLIDTTNFFVALYDEEENLYTFPYWVDERDDEFGPQRLRDSLTDYVRRTGKPHLINGDLHVQLAQDGEVGLIGPPSHIWLGAPLMTAGKVIGVVVVQSYTEKSLYDVQDLALLTYVSEHIAWAIERKRIAEALRESMETARAILDNPIDSIILIDTEGVILDINETAAARYGKSTAELIGVRVHDLMPPRLAESRRAHEARVVQTGQPTRYEDSRAGIWFDTSVMPVFDSEGNVSRLAIVAHDITAWKQAEEAVRESEERLRALVENLSEGIAIVDKDGTHIATVQTRGPVTGYAREERFGKSIFDLIHPDDALRVKESLARIVEHPEDVLVEEVRAQHKDGSWRVIEAFARNLLGNPAIQGILITTRDITERRQVEEALRQSEERLLALVGNLSEGIAILDAEGNEIGNIPTKGPDTGYTPEERHGRSIFELIHPDDAPRVKESLARVLSHPGESVAEELRTRHKDGSWQVIDAKAKNMLDHPAIRGIVITSRDITEQRQAEEALRRRDAILEAVNSAAESFLQTPDWRQVIGDVLEGIGKATGVDRVAIFKAEGGQGDSILASLRYEWVAEGVSPYVDDPRFHAVDVVQAGYERELPLWRRGELTYGHAREAPPGRHLLQQIWGSLSAINVPILVREELWGLIIFNMVTREREWAEEEIEALQIAANMLGTVIERYQVEQALRESEGLWRNLVETMPQGFGMRDENSVSTYANATFCRMLGYLPEEILGHNLDDFLSEASRIQLREQLARQKEGRPSNYELVWIAKDGHEVPTIVSPRPILDVDGNFKGSFAVITDITDLKQAEESLQHYAARLRALREIDQAILEAESSDAIVQVTLRHVQQLIPCERVSVGLFDFETQEREVIAVDAGDRATVEQDAPHYHPLDPRWIDVLNLGEPIVIDDIRTFPEPLPALQAMVDRGILCLATVPLFAEGQLIGSLNLMAKEVSAFSEEHLEVASQVADQLAIAVRQARLHERVQRHAEELEARVAERTAELQAANAHLEELSQVKTEFVSNVTHELRTPITSIKLHLHLLSARPEKRDKYMATLEREALRLESLVGNLLYVSRLDQDRIASNVTQVDLNDLIATYVSDRTPVALDRGLTLTLKAARKLPPIQADPEQLGQVVSVLLTNAINYTPEGGQIVVSTRTRRAKGRQWVVFVVSDTGPGIPAEEQEHLFERFYRGEAGRKSDAPGTGLGLAIASEIVERHGGRIEVASEGIPGKGAAFTVWLPAA